MKEKIRKQLKTIQSRLDKNFQTKQQLKIPHRIKNGSRMRNAFEYSKLKSTHTTIRKIKNT